MSYTFTIKKKLFDVGPAQKKTSLSLSAPMYAALDEIAKQTNQSIPQVIIDALEQVLTGLVEQNVIKKPKSILIPEMINQSPVLKSEKKLG